MRLVTYVSVDDSRPIQSITKLCRESLKVEKALTELVLAAREQGTPGPRLVERSERRSKGAWRRFVRGPLGERFEENEAT